MEQKHATTSLHPPLPLPFSANVGSIYSEYKDEDGFLYVCYSGESTFG